MRIIYVHHALRDRKEIPTQEDGLKDLGKEDAILTGKILKEITVGKNIAGIFTSPYFRCKETTRLINESLNVNVYKDEKLNEYTEWDPNNDKHETWVDLQIRLKEAIKDVVYKYNDDDVAIFVTSGVNIMAFISLAYRVAPSENTPGLWVASCSPIGFDIDKTHFEK